MCYCIILRQWQRQQITDIFYHIIDSVRRPHVTEKMLLHYSQTVTKATDHYHLLPKYRQWQATTYHWNCATALFSVTKATSHWHLLRYYWQWQATTVHWYVLLQYYQSQKQQIIDLCYHIIDSDRRQQHCIILRQWQKQQITDICYHIIDSDRRQEITDMCYCIILSDKGNRSLISVTLL